MTAFEILLNKLYDSIENNEPSSIKQIQKKNSTELFSAVKEFVNLSFFHGRNLSDINMIIDSLNKVEFLLKRANHEQWEHIKFIFIENDLNSIRRDRKQKDVQFLKLTLDQSLNV